LTTRRSQDARILLASRSQDGKVKKDLGKVLVPVIPRALRAGILKEFHDAPQAGHMGVKKTKERIKSRVYWPKMNKDIAEYVKTCEICQKVKYENQKPAGLKGTYEPAKAVFETVSVDLMGP